MTHSALAVGLDQGTMRHFVARARSRNLDVECVAQARRATEMACERRFELIACAYPLPDMVMREFGNALRHRTSASKNAALLVLSLPDMQAEAGRGLPSGRALVRSRRDNGPLLYDAISHLLRVAPRTTLDVPVEVSPDDGAEPGSGIARLVNVSKSGMLLASSDPPEVGSRWHFCFSTEPDAEPVSGAGVVVRHSRPGRSTPRGFAIRITSLLPGAEDRLLRILEPS